MKWHTEALTKIKVNVSDANTLIIRKRITEQIKNHDPHN